MKLWVAASALLLALIALAASAAPPVSQWTKGDWWEVQLEQQMVHTDNLPMVWGPSFRLRFTVTQADEKGATVEVTTVPENSFKQRLSLLYSRDGKLTSALVIDPDRTEALGPAGSLGIFGPLGREAFDLSQAPADQPAAPVGPADQPVAAPLARPETDGTVRVSLDPDGRISQFWEAGAAFWKRYEVPGAMPQRGTLANGYWVQRTLHNLASPKGGAGKSGSGSSGGGRSIKSPKGPS